MYTDSELRAKLRTILSNNGYNKDVINYWFEYHYNYEDYVQGAGFSKPTTYWLNKENSPPLVKPTQSRRVINAVS